MMSNMSRVVHCKRESYDIYIGRPSRWGNPYPLDKEEDRDKVIAQYEEWIRTQPHLMAALPELRGKTLGCWCFPRRCHGDILVKLLEELDNKPDKKEAAQE